MQDHATWDHSAEKGCPVATDRQKAEDTLDVPCTGHGSVVPDTTRRLRHVPTP